MHDTALEFGKKFFSTYINESREFFIVDIGSQDVNGSLRPLAPLGSKYIGVDFVSGKGVDIIINDPYSLPFADNSVDVCVCSSCFEHVKFFWLLYTDILRILKPNGIFYLNVPSNGEFHKYPVDCWRFYPDSGIALQDWGRRNGYNSILLESFTGRQGENIWNDFIAVFLKDERYVQSYPTRIQDKLIDFTNGYTLGHQELSNFSSFPEDYLYYEKKRKKIIGRLKMKIEKLFFN